MDHHADRAVVCCILLSFLLAVGRGESTDLYQLLNVTRDSTTLQIRQAFKRLALHTHPDKNKNEDAADQFLRLTAAYETLRNAESRRRYDLHGETGSTATPGGRQSYHSWSYYHDYVGLYDNDPEVETLDGHDFGDLVLNSDELWFVNFYSPACSHCHHLAPEWRRLARAVHGVLHVAAVNCADEWHLCRSLHIEYYPTLIFYPKRVEYSGERVYTALHRFAVSHLSQSPIDLDTTNWRRLLSSSWALTQHWLLFFCSGEHQFGLDDEERIRAGVNSDGFTHNCVPRLERLKLVAMLQGVVNVAQVNCATDRVICASLGHNESSVLFNGAPLNTSGQLTDSLNVKVIELLSAQEIVSEVVDLLPNAPELKDGELKAVLDSLSFCDISNETTVTTTTEPPLPSDRASHTYLLLFLPDHISLHERLELLRVPVRLSNTRLRLVRCDLTVSLCTRLLANQKPTHVQMALVFPEALGGGVEMFHGTLTASRVASFVDDVIRGGSRVCPLDGDGLALAVMGGVSHTNGGGWLVDFYAPWCPACVRLLPELRRISRLASVSSVRFGSVDCTVHSALCSRFNIRSYPTLILYSQRNIQKLPDQFGSPDSERSVARHVYHGQLVGEALLEFLQDRTDPAVIDLTGLSSLNRLVFGEAVKPVGQLWLIFFRANWCGPCQRFEPHYHRTARHIAALHNVILLTVDCASEGSFCRQHQIDSYPTVRLYSDSSRTLSQYNVYSGSRDWWTLLDWTLAHLPAAAVAVQLSDSGFDQYLEKSDSWQVVLLYSPSCVPCRQLLPVFRLAALVSKSRHSGQHSHLSSPLSYYRLNIRDFIFTLEICIYLIVSSLHRMRSVESEKEDGSRGEAVDSTSSLRFASVDCDQYRRLCLQLSVHSYPVLRLYSTAEIYLPVHLATDVGNLVAATLLQAVDETLQKQQFSNSKTSGGVHVETVMRKDEL